MKRPYNIPTTPQSIKMRFEAGKITLREAAIEFCRAGFSTFVDERLAKEYIEDTKI